MLHRRPHAYTHAGLGLDVVPPRARPGSALRRSINDHRSACVTYMRINLYNLGVKKKMTILRNIYTCIHTRTAVVGEFQT